MATKTTRKGTPLIIVESPTKAKTMARFLGKDYVIKATMGHVRDLPPKKLGIDIEDNFAVKYEKTPKGKEVIADIASSARVASEVYLATDPDREGEAISWHIFEGAGMDKLKSVKRVVFHEITGAAVKEALADPREIDSNMVNAQQARRVLDRIVGYKISPILWKKVSKGLSAGRVQSVALKLIVEREEEIEKFKSEEYWVITAELAADGKSFIAQLQPKDEKGKKKVIANKQEADLILDALRSSNYRVAELEQKTVKHRPVPPYTTSTFQQDASRRLNINSKASMQIAQQLYEGISLGSQGSVGLITYMRTDSFNLANEALKEIGGFIVDTYGSKYGGKPRRYKNKSKGAQEAHEAIRPTSVLRTPESVSPFLDSRQARIYELIWKRAVRSQMADALTDDTVAEIEATATDGKTHQLRARGSVMKFDGHYKLDPRAMASRNKGSDDDEEQTDGLLPPLKQGMALELTDTGANGKQKFTQPPPRYNEARLIQVLEKNNVGRPSTYASIVSTIEGRKYVVREKKFFHPTSLGRMVCEFLTNNFQNIIDVKFTARMEEELDQIAKGELEWIPMLSRFYGPFKKQLDVVSKAEESGELCDECGKPLLVRVSRRGKFLGCSGYPKCKNLKPYGDEPVEEVVESGEFCEKCEKPMLVRTGRMGQFLGCSGYPKCKNAKPLKEEGEEATDEFCEKCERPMSVRAGRLGKFLGCTGYPECKNARPLKEDRTEILCPRCEQGHLTRRRSKRGKPFYGCPRYPECDFATSLTPHTEPCPQCGGLTGHTARKQVLCTDDQCGWKQPGASKSGGGRRATSKGGAKAS